MLSRRALTLAFLMLVVTVVTPASASMETTTKWHGSIGGFNQTFAVVFDATGAMHVVNRGSGKVDTLTTDGAFLSDWDGTSTTTTTTFFQPFDIAFGPAGDVYVSDNDQRVLRFDSSGGFIGMFGKGVNHTPMTSTPDVCLASTGDICGAGTTGTAARQFSGPRSLAIDSSGNVWVADANNARIQKFDAAMNFVQMWGKDVGGTGVDTCTVPASCQGGTPDQGTGSFWSPNDLAFDPGGNVYVADGSNNRIQEFGSSMSFLKMWGKGVGGLGLDTCTAPTPCQFASAGGEGGQFSNPTSIAFDSAGNFYVVENGARAQKFSASGTFVRAWGQDAGGAGVDSCTVAANCQTGTSGTAESRFTNPTRITVGPSGHVYVSEFTNQRVQEFDATGDFIRMMGLDVGGTGTALCTSGCQAGTGAFDNLPFDDPEDIARTSTGDLLVAEFNKDRISVFDSSGRSRRVFGSTGGGDGELNSPEGSAAAPLGNLYVADYNNNRIDQFTPGGAFIRAWGKDVGGVGNGSCLAGCAAGVAGSGAGEFDHPSGVAVDSNGSVYVVDLNNRVQKFGPSGNFLAQFGTTGSGAGQLDYPWKVAVDADDHVWVSEFDNNRVSVFSSSGSFLRAYGKDVGGSGLDTCTTTCQTATGGTAPGAFDYPAGVAVDSEGSFYVSDSQHDRIQMFRPSGVFVKSWGATGSGDGMLHAPNSLALGSGRLYVADSTNNRIQAFSETDQAAPETTIDSGPSGSTTDTSPSFGFSSSEPSGALFECSFDGSAFAPCSSPYATGALSLAEHTFSVRAIDGAGNVDASPATRTFTVGTAPAGGGTPDGGSQVPTTTSPTPTLVAPPTPAQIRAAMSANLSALARLLGKTKRSAVLRRRGLALAGAAAPAAGTLLISVSAKSNAAARVVLLKGTRKFTAAGRARLSLKLTKAGKKLLRRSRKKVALGLTATFADSAGRRTSATRKATLKAG